MGLTNISWCDYTFNPVIGCKKVSEGCAHCYAESLDARRFSKTMDGGTKAEPVSHWGPGAPRHVTADSGWKEILTLNREAGLGNFRQCDVCGRREVRKWDKTLPPGGLSCCSNPDCLSLPESESFVVRPRVFCASLADWLDPEWPKWVRPRLLEWIWRTPNLDWLLLSKRPENFRRLVTEAWNSPTAMIPAGLWLSGNPLPNVWVGTSVENQKRADERVPELLKIPARVRFLSCEPLLGEINLGRVEFGPIGSVNHTRQSVLTPTYMGRFDAKIHWVISGGESGPKCRPFDVNWARSLRDQCRAAGCAYFLKQLGGHPDKRGALEDLPDDLRIREFPKP